jgi:DNA-binding protein H-NS
MDLNSLSLQELRKLKEKVEREIGKREAAGKKTLLKRLQQMAADEGLTMEDLLPSAPKACGSACQEGAETARRSEGQDFAGAQVRSPRRLDHHLDRPRPQARLGAQLGE